MAGYRELPPPPELAHLVRCLWVRRTGPPATVDVLPDGCVDVIVRDGHATTAGPDTRPAPTPVGADETIVGIRFRPGAAGGALGLPASELRDLRVPLDDVWGPFAHELAERAEGDPRLLAAAVAKRLRDHAMLDRVAVAAAARLERRPGTPLPELARALGVGERQLRRRFTAGVGYGPKTFARIARFRMLLGLLEAGEPLAAAAAEAGYSDQPHMTREAVALTGRTPGALR